jgi:hypothetical protein
MNALRRSVLGLAALLTALAALSAVASAAVPTESVDVFKASFGGATSTPPNPYPLTKEDGHHAIAVDNSGGPSDGDIYVTDPQNFRVEKFNPAGQLLLMFGKEVNKTAVETPGSTTVEQNLCVIASGDICQSGVEEVSNEALQDPRAIAVDNSSGPSAGDIYVGGNSAFAVEQKDYMLKYAPDGHQIFNWGKNGEIKRFFIDAVATDPTNGYVYELDNGKMEGFDPSGNQVSSVLFPTSQEVFQFAIDSNHNFYKTTNSIAEEGYSGLIKISPRASILARVENQAEYPAAVTVDPENDDVYTIQQAGGGYVNHYDGYCGGFCTAIDKTAGGHFGDDLDFGVGLNRLYVAEYEGEVRVYEVRGARETAGEQTFGNETEAEVTGHIDPDGKGAVTACRVEYGPIASPTMSGSAPCDKQSIGAPEDVTARITGLAPGTTYRFRFAATNASGQTHGLSKHFYTDAAPVISSFSAASVSANGAELTARISPSGAETRYRVEYGTTVAYGGVAPIPAGTLTTELGTAQEVTVPIGGLEPTSIYHFRVVAENQYGTTTSADQSFGFHPSSCPNETVRQQTGSVTLPDCRAFELVSARNSGDSVLFPAMGPNTGRAVGPPRLAYDTWGGVVPESGQAANTAGDMYVATRTDEGWVSKYIGLPSNEAFLTGGPPWATGTASGESFSLAEADKNQTGVVANQDMSKIVDWNLGQYTDPEIGFFGGEGTHSSNAPYVWDSTTGERLDRWPTNVGVVPGGEEFKGKTAFSADLSHFVFGSNVAFAHGGKPGDVYDDNTVTGSVTIASLAADGTNLTDLTPLKVSEDGSDIVMTTGVGLCGGSKQTALACGPGELYVRAGGTTTYEVAPGSIVNFLGITADGSKLFLSSEERLTPNDHDSSNDIYMWSEAKAKAGEPPLTLISLGDHGEVGNTDNCHAFWTTRCGVQPVEFTTATNGGYTQLQGGVGGNGFSDSYIASDSGEIYFYSPEQLEGSRGIADNQNLYVYRGGHAQLVAALAPGQICTADQSLLCSSGPVARMDVSPDGSHMAFITASRVTEYDNAGFTEMYTYEAATGKLACASCVPNGEVPTFDVYGSQNGLFMSDDGRAFFYTEQALTPQDTNRGEDVYEFAEGRPQLVTAGTGAGYQTEFGIIGVVTSPGLVGVSGTGTDVYFGTYEHLVLQDENGQELKIYDARTNGGFPAVKPPPGCAAADECHGGGSAAPPSQTEGTGAGLGTGGNLAPVHKKKAKHHKKKHPKHAKKKATKSKGGAKSKRDAKKANRGANHG